VLCVRTPWEHAQVYGPQKGADAGTVRRLAARLDAYADQLARDPRGVPMTGAAGGLSGGLWAALGARREPGPTAQARRRNFQPRCGLSCTKFFKRRVPARTPGGNRGTHCGTDRWGESPPERGVA
jgi:hypothetical protein